MHDVNMAKHNETTVIYLRGAMRRAIAKVLDKYNRIREILTTQNVTMADMNQLVVHGVAIATHTTRVANLKFKLGLNRPLFGSTLVNKQ